jgi:hypothetical protein
VLRIVADLLEFFFGPHRVWSGSRVLVEPADHMTAGDEVKN